MATINRTDLLQVTARSCGTVLMTLTISGASTLTDVFRQVRETAPIDTGMVTVHLRNRTQGWTQQHNLVFRQSRPNTYGKSNSSTHDDYPSLFA